MDRKVLLVAMASLVAVGSAVESDVRIVGGHPVNIDTVPYQVSLAIQYGRFLFHTCGGSILNENTIFTAAHCVSSKAVYFIRAGSNSNRYGGQLIGVSQVYVHPRNNASIMDYDFAILKLKQKLVFGSFVKPISLADSDRFYQPGVDAIVTGWGVLQNDGAISERLRIVTVPIVSHEVCARIYASINSVTGRMFCAGLLGVGGKDSCQGDSGGPLVVNDVLVGVVSWGNLCADPLFPGVYASVLAVRDWIDPLMVQ